jgi:hypothetical protein
VGVLLPAPGGGAFLVSGDPPRYDPTAAANAPLTDLAHLASVPSAGLDASVSAFAASGSRLVAAYVAQGSLAFDLVHDAGAPGAWTSGAQGIGGTFGAIAPQLSFAQADNGSLLVAAAAVAPDPDGGAPLVVAARLAWVFDDGSDNVAKGSPHVDVESYGGLSAGTLVIGPTTLLDPSTAFVVTADRNNLSGSAAQVVGRPAAGAEAGAPTRRHALAADPSRVGAVASHGMVYVLTSDVSADAATPEEATLHVFAPSCPP